MLSALKSHIPRSSKTKTKTKTKTKMVSSKDSKRAQELTKLVKLISSSVQDVISQYQVNGHNLPWLSSMEPGPFDKPHFAPEKLTKAIQIIEAACAQLSFAVASLGHVITNVSPKSPYICQHIADT